MLSTGRAPPFVVVCASSRILRLQYAESHPFTASTEPGTMMNVLMTVVILYIILTASSVTGVVFKLGNEELIPTDGSGRLLINAIDMNVRIEESDAGLTIVRDDEKALLCHSTKTAVELGTPPQTNYWYLDHEVNTTTRSGSLIRENENDRGWTRVIGRIRLVENGAFYRAAFLKRGTENAMEGKFTCHIDNDSDNDKYLLILYPILSVLVSVSVDSESPYQFRIECTSTGGRALNMSITGPHGEVLPLNSIQPVGTQRWLGNDSYTCVGIVDYVDSGEYSCEASNGVSSVNGSYIIRVTKGPSSIRLKRISPSEVKVEWSHPPGGVTVAGYIVLYKDGNVTMNMTVPASNTNVVISVLPLKYSISVIAILNETQYLLGRSSWKTISIWSPEEVKWKSLGSDSVRVSWEAVEYADYYTVSFSQTVGDDQEGLCKNESHFASVTVPATDRTADVIIPVGDEVEIDNTSVLRAFTTYSVKIVPFSTVWGESVGSKPINITTPSKKPTIAPTNLTLVNTTSTTIKVKWRSDLSPCRLVNRPITGFRIQYKVKNESEKALTTTGITTNATLTGLHPLTNYTIRVAGVNSAGIGPYCDSIMAMTNKTSSSDGPGDNISGTSIGGIIAGIITMFLVSLVCVLLAAFALRKFSRREKKTTSIERFAIHVESTDGPNIVRFPSEFVQVNERERVVFDVRVEGNPRPQLTWYYDDREVVGTDSIDLGLDGSLTLPCSEPSHTGVYQLVAVNSIGQTEKEVELIVRKDKQPIPKNAGENISIPPVPVTGFIEYVTNCHAYGDELLKEQFTVLDVDPELPTTIGTDPDVELLNRFPNITVYDTNRIMLTPIEGQLDWCQRDYINACYIDGYKTGKKFIATQGPLAETVVDFWRLVWQERPATIVMLTDLKEEETDKCHKYWPDSGTQLFGPFKLTITYKERFTDYTSRSFFLKLENGGSQNFQVTQLQ